MARVSVIYSAVVAHDMSGAVTVEGRVTVPAPVEEDWIRELMIESLVNGDVPEEWNWVPEKIHVVQFFWTDAEVIETPEKES